MSDLYNVYVDASGDNGFRFEKGSTTCYSVAIFATKTSDEEYNHEILINIKTVLHAKPRDEVKYSTLRRHKNSELAHTLMGQAKGILVLAVVRKQLMQPKELLTSVIHSLPIDNIPKIIGENNVGNIFIDQMKRPEELGVNYLLRESKTAATINDGNTPIGERVLFEDSKRAKLLQLADFYAGAARYFFEEYEKREHPLPCVACFGNIGKNHGARTKFHQKSLCKAVLKKQPLVHFQEMRKLAPLVYKNDGHALLHGFIWLPMTIPTAQFMFVACLLFPEK